MRQIPEIKYDQDTNNSMLLAQELYTYVVNNPGIAAELLEPTGQDLSPIIDSISKELTGRLEELGVTHYAYEVRTAIEFIFSNYENFICFYTDVLEFWGKTTFAPDYPIENIVNETIEGLVNSYNFTRAQLELVIKIAYQQFSIEKGGNSSYLWAAFILALIVIFAAYIGSRESNNQPVQLPPINLSELDFSINRSTLIPVEESIPVTAIPTEVPREIDETLTLNEWQIQTESRFRHMIESIILTIDTTDTQNGQDVEELSVYLLNDLLNYLKYSRIKTQFPFDLVGSRGPEGNVQEFRSFEDKTYVRFRIGGLDTMTSLSVLIDEKTRIAHVHLRNIYVNPGVDFHDINAAFSVQIHPHGEVTILAGHVRNVYKLNG